MEFLNSLKNRSKHYNFPFDHWELEKPLTKEAINGINELSREAIDPEGRHWKNALDLMMSDGILNILPKTNDSWIDFIKPFLRLSRIEKDFYKNTKIKKNEI